MLSFFPFPPLPRRPGFSCRRGPSSSSLFSGERMITNLQKKLGSPSFSSSSSFLFFAGPFSSSVSWKSEQTERGMDPLHFLPESLQEPSDLFL